MKSHFRQRDNIHARATYMCVDPRGYMTSGWRNLFKNRDIARIPRLTVSIPIMAPDWKLINIVFIVAKLKNICFGRKSCVRETKMFLTSGKNIFFRAAKFVSATCFPRG